VEAFVTTAYRQHLASPEWKEIRRQAVERSLGLCELCKAAGSETHHIQYPKGYANDNAGNVLHICSACHRRLHGMSQLITDRQLVGIEVSTFKKRSARLWVDERRWVWASWSVWAKHLVIPRPMEERVLGAAVRAARELERRRGQPFLLPNPDNEQWLRWHAMRAALQIWFDAMRRKIPPGSTFGIEHARLTHDERTLYDNYVAICDWGDDLQEQALAGALTAVPSNALPAPTQTSDRLQQAMVLLVGEQFAIREQVGDHEQRIALVEAVVVRDPAEFITTKKFVAEMVLDTTDMVPGTRLNPQAWLGMQMKNGGHEEGPPKKQRLEGTGRVIEAKTWRRSDLVAALAAMPK
jgi:hypothetical protein